MFQLDELRALALNATDSQKPVYEAAIKLLETVQTEPEPEKPTGLFGRWATYQGSGADDITVPVLVIDDTPDRENDVRVRWATGDGYVCNDWVPVESLEFTPSPSPLWRTLRAHPRGLWWLSVIRYLSGKRTVG